MAKCSVGALGKAFMNVGVETCVALRPRRRVPESLAGRSRERTYSNGVSIEQRRGALHGDCSVAHFVDDVRGFAHRRLMRDGNNRDFATQLSERFADRSFRLRVERGRDLSTDTEELCQGRCGPVRLYYWRFRLEPAGTAVSLGSRSRVRHGAQPPRHAAPREGARTADH